MGILLEIKNLKKSFGNNEVLKGIDFSVNEGEVITIIGSSGSGKSTLLRCINLLEEPDSGEIIFEGKNVLDVYQIYVKQSKTKIKYGNREKQRKILR